MKTDWYDNPENVGQRILVVLYNIGTFIVACVILFVLPAQLSIFIQSFFPLSYYEIGWIEHWAWGMLVIIVVLLISILLYFLFRWIITGK